MTPKNITYLEILFKCMYFWKKKFVFLKITRKYDIFGRIMCVVFFNMMLFINEKGQWTEKMKIQTSSNICDKLLTDIFSRKFSTICSVWFSWCSVGGSYQHFSGRYLVKNFDYHMFIGKSVKSFRLFCC